MRNGSAASLTDYDHEVETQLSAFNSAFADLGLRFRWNAQMLRSLTSIDGDQARVAAYIRTYEPHLLHAYSAEFLSSAIMTKKSAQARNSLPAAVPAEAAEVVMRESLFSGCDACLPSLTGA